MTKRSAKPPVKETSKNVSARRQSTEFAKLNTALTALHWQIGHYVRTYMLEGQRAEYGAQIVSTASRQLAERYGRGWCATRTCA